MIKAGLQNTLLKEMSESGCYFLCIVHIGEMWGKKDVDVVSLASKCIENGWMKSSFEVKNPDKILGEILGRRVDVVSTEDKSLYPNANAIVNCWYNKRTGFTHFTTDDFDPLTNSVTVKEGKIVSYRMFIW